jgi:two-component system sensor kinase FixL
VPHRGVSLLRRYGVAAALTGLALALRLFVPFLVGLRVPYIQFYPAVLAAAWYGGVGPGLFATALSSLATIYWFLPAPGGLALQDPRDVATLLAFIGVGVCISWLNGSLRRAHVEQRSALALATSRADRLDAILRTTVDGIIVIDERGTIESFNAGAEALFGYPQSEVLGRSVSMLMPSPYREEHDGYLQRYLATGRGSIIGKGRQVSGRRRDGGEFPLHLSVGEMMLEGERKFTGIVHDLSQRIAIEQRLREQAALARLGEMAAVIAHEVKNPLAAIRGAIQVIGQRVPVPADRAVVTEIVARIDMLDRLMKELLLFARPPSARPVPTDVARLVLATADLLARDPLMRDIRVEVAGSVPPIPADASMLQIVFQNLLLNSAQSMSGGGQIDVSVHVNGDACQISVSDTGPGIPPDIRDRIFTPFFTTKARGSGLGLPTAKRLIEAHRGEMSVECPPEGGTTFHIRLPLAE